MPNRFVARFSPPLLALLAVVWAGTAAAQTGMAIVSGQVTDSTARAPLSGVEIFISADVGGAALRSTRTNAEGRYSIAAVPAGNFSVNARLIGFAAKAIRITTRAGETTTADFALSQRTTQLDQVVITGTGGVTQRRAVGNEERARRGAGAKRRSADRRAHAGSHHAPVERPGRHRGAGAR